MDRNIWKSAQQYYRRSSERKLSRGVVIGLLFLSMTLAAGFGVSVTGANAQSAAVCPAGNRSHTVTWGETLSGIALRYGANWSTLASHNRLINPNLIFPGQRICIPTSNAASQDKAPSLASQTKTQAPATTVEGMINQVFGMYAPAAIRVAKCESGLNPNATNPISVGGSHAAGVFQILYPSTWNTTSQRAKSPYDAWANINAAYEIFKRDGYSWREWACKP